MNFQIENMEGFLQWVKTCPYAYSISSMSGGFIHVKILIPVFLILSIAWSVLWIPPNQVESRLTTSIVALLALIAYNFVFNEDLPKLSYLTSMDKYILISYLFCCIPTFLTVYFSRINQRDYNKAVRMNKKSRLYGSIIYAILVVLSFSNI